MRLNQHSRMNCRTLGVIPARGGSKRIPNKNLKEVEGKPLVAHTIEHASKSDHLTEIVVSTEDPEIKRVAEEYGGNVPFDRPEELATDTAKTRQVVTHALDWFEERGETFDYVCRLQPTSPLRKSEDIDGCIAKIHETDATAVMTVSEYFFPPEWSLTERDDGYLTEYLVDGYLFDEGQTRSQNTGNVFCSNGAVSIADVEVWREVGMFYTDKSLPYVIPRIRSLDIDEPEDLIIVRALMKSGKLDL